tara:strand:+ start:505 stop:711 length:207 start_codon:yes stop_codon:yes gene_type:complete
MANIFTKHPKEVGETYFQHMLAALRFSFTFILLFVVAIIHSIFPFLFTKTASCVVQAMAKHMAEREKC